MAAPSRGLRSPTGSPNWARPRTASGSAAAPTSSCWRSRRAAERWWTRCVSCPARTRHERRGVRPYVRGGGDAVVVRRDARHQPLPARRRVAGGGGGGPGNTLAHCRRFGRTVGVVLSDEAVRFCRSRGVAAARGSLLSLPFPDGSFDAVTSFDVLYHRWVEDDRIAVREIVRVMRPGGLLLLRVPALKMLWGAHDEAVHSRHRYTRGEVRRLLESEGLDVVRLTYANMLLFPLLALRRTLDRLLGRHASDVGFLPAPLEWTVPNLLARD